jgi:hypothetical protein
MAFTLIIVVTLIRYFNFEELTDTYASQSSYLATAVFYIILSLYILVKAILSKINNRRVINEAYRGDSFWLSFLMKSGWQQSLVQNLAEPMLFLAFGFFLLPVNLYWGIPLIFFAVSTWAHLGMEAVMELDEIRNSLSNKGYVYAKGSKFSKPI